MSVIEFKKIAPGLYWISVPSRQVHLQAGCPADSVKHLIKHGIIRNQSQQGLHETGPNCLLLSDLGIQNGQFANLAEFTILQMFYRQGMLIPGHPGYTQSKAMMIGNDEQIKAQLDYVFRGNYGLISAEELMEAGLNRELALEMMRLKLKFAFGRIQATHDLIDCRNLQDEKIEIKNGVYIQRLSINRFRVSVDSGESIEVDLNLAAHEAYQPTYKLNFQRFAPEFFSVIHSGEGDGWDIHRPAMASIICYGPDVYLIDAGPHITHTLRALGFSLNSVRGIFQTHGHDDHFAGLTELMLGDRKLEYYSTSIVRHSVNKKMQALLSVKFPVLERFFTIHDLVPEQWNNIDGLEVLPNYSPHPVETNTFQFRTVTENGHRSYHHLADICSFTVLQKMIEPDANKPGISMDYFQRIKELYLQPADLKKIDIGGGMIHGHAEDFQGDRSKKIILAHTAEELSPSQLSIGSRALFGQIDHLVKSHIDNRHEVAARSLHHYFPTVPFTSFYELLNQPIETLEPGTMLVRNPSHHMDIFLVLSGIIASPKSELALGLEYVAGFLVGDDPDCPLSQLVSKSFAEVLRIPRRIFDSFLERYNLKDAFSKNISRRRMLQSSDLFQSIKWSPLLNKIAKSVYEIQIKEQQIVSHFTGHFVFILESGLLSLFREGYAETLRPGQFCYEDNVITDHPPLELQLKASESSRGFLIPHVVIKDIPAVEWKLLETYKRRSQAILKQPYRQKTAS